MGITDNDTGRTFGGRNPGMMSAPSAWDSGLSPVGPEVKRNTRPLSPLDDLIRAAVWAAVMSAAKGSHRTMKQEERRGREAKVGSHRVLVLEDEATITEFPRIGLS
jgi:predicted RNA binding protein YcfA (HicA-like mRNA interferase family)